MRAPNRSTSTPTASAAMAQSRGRGGEAAEDPTQAAVGLTAGLSAEETAGAAPDHSVACVSEAVARAAVAQPYERERDDPVFRPLRIYALDPAASPREGGVATVDVPYEPLAPTRDGWQGALFEIDCRDGRTGLRYRSAPLDETRALLEAGVTPSVTDPAFPQQMVYAVCMLTYAAFQSALGRDLTWGFPRGADGTTGASDGRTRLRLRPFAGAFHNAYYDQDAGALAFGYFRADAATTGRTLPRGFVFTALAHDVVTHEATHALLDGLRARFTVPSNPDVLAFHEALADLVALFQRFSYPDMVRRALAATRGDLAEADVLTGLARQIAETTGHTAALRSAVAEDGTSPPSYADAPADPHGRSLVLTSAVFEAFLTVFRRKASALIRLATGGSGVLPPGHLPAPLLDALADKASALAGQFLTICVRAVDYCPPVDLEFGEYLRAALTADYDLVPDDPWGYREAWVDAFRRRGIFPSHVASLSTDALLWRVPPVGTPPVPGLAAPLPEPGTPLDRATRLRQAEALRAYLAAPGRLAAFGMQPPGPLQGDERGGVVEAACVESVRSSRRVGPDRQVAFDYVAEVTQRWCVEDDAGRACTFYGGATLLLSRQGAVRYVIAKDPASRRRAARQRRFMGSSVGRRFWAHGGEAVVPAPHPFRLLHPEG